MLVLINPFSGGGKAPSVWRRLHALLEPTGIQMEVIETKYAGHAREMMKTLAPLDAYAGVCTVSGDGLIYEVINGLMERDDGREAVQHIAIAPAPGGTANGLWKSILHKAGESFDLIGTAFLIAKGRPAPVDMWEYVRPANGSDAEQHLGWSVLSLSWGIVSDVDIESEVLRFAGALRLTLYALWRIACLRKYSACLTYLDAVSGEWKSIDANKWVHGSCSVEHYPPIRPRPLRLTACAAVPRSWVGLWACNVPWMSESDCAAPEAELNNGTLDVLALVGASRLKTIGIFLALSDGSHIASANEDSVRMLKVKALRLEPSRRTSAAPGHVVVDGEVVPFGPIEARAHPGALRVLLRSSGD